MSTNKIEIDLDISIEDDGKVYAHVYVGEGSCEPVVEESLPLESLIESLLQAYLVPVGEKIAPYHLDACEQLVKKLKAATKYAKKRIKELS